jgi:hypothetical protein
LHTYKSPRKKSLEIYQKLSFWANLSSEFTTFFFLLAWEDMLSNVSLPISYNTLNTMHIPNSKLVTSIGLFIPVLIEWQYKLPTNTALTA